MPSSAKTNDASSQSLLDLIVARQGDLNGEWPYECVFHDGTKRYECGVSKGTAATKVLQVRRCTQSEVTQAALEALQKTDGQHDLPGDDA